MTQVKTSVRLLRAGIGGCFSPASEVEGRSPMQNSTGRIMKAVQVLLADDHEVVRCGLRTIIESRPEYRVAGEAVNGREAIEKAKALRPDLVVMDISMPYLNGLEATRQIVKEDPTIKILVLTMHNSEQVMRAVLEAGARGYLLKSDAGRDLLTGLDTLMKHHTFFTSQAADMILDGYLHSSSQSSGDSVTMVALSPREREVMQLLAEGKSTKEAAAVLGMSVRTAETHRTHIMRKLHLGSFSDLVRYAIRNRIIEA